MSWAVSASIVSLMVAICPCFISRRMTSTARSVMRLASSWMVIASGMVTSRTSFSFGSALAWPLSRWVRRRNEATERSRTSSARSAVTKVRRPRSLAGAPRGAAGRAAAGRAAPGRRDVRGVSSSSTSSVRRPGTAFLTSSSPKRFLATSPALRLASSSCLRRSSSSRLRDSAASRSLRSMASRLARTFASSSAILRSSASRRRESASACARATRSSSVKVRSTTPDGLGASAGDGATALASTGFFLAVSFGAGSGFASGAAPMLRRFTFSTTTCLLRP